MNVPAKRVLREARSSEVGLKQGTVELEEYLPTYAGPETFSIEDI